MYVFFCLLTPIHFIIQFVALFTILLFLKAFHWLVEDRVDYVSVFCSSFWITVQLFMYKTFYFCFLDGKKSHHILALSL